jgi:hypothetical protein
MSQCCGVCQDTFERGDTAEIRTTARPGFERGTGSRVDHNERRTMLEPPKPREVFQLMMSLTRLGIATSSWRKIARTSKPDLGIAARSRGSPHDNKPQAEQRIKKTQMQCNGTDCSAQCKPVLMNLSLSVNTEQRNSNILRDARTLAIPAKRTGCSQ